MKMLTQKILAAAAFAIAISAAPSWAAEGAVGGAGNAAVSAPTSAGDAAANASGDAAATASTDGTTASATASGNLGVSLSAAGDTPQTQTAFFNSLTPAEQASVKGKCSDSTAAKSFTAQEKAFCEVAAGSK
jgi:hypothetical protein